MQVTRPTSSTREQGASAVDGATLQQTRWWETTYTTVSWDYPPSPVAYYDALLSRGASHSRFLRIAYSSTRHRSTSSAPCSPLVSSSPTPPSPLDTPTSPHLTSTTPLTCPDGPHRKPAIHLPPIPPYPLSRSCVNARPRSANPMSHTLKRRKPQWPKPPHYHASLLRSPLSRRKGLFRAVLPPNKAVDFLRWDVLVGARVSLSCQERDWTRSVGVDACASLHVAESVLEPYEAAAGFFGWHGLGLDVTRRVQGNCVDERLRCWSEGLGFERDGAGKRRSSVLLFEIDEAVVEEGRAMWARTAEELVGPPGLALRSVFEDSKSGKVTPPLDPAHKHVDVHPPSSISSRREEVRWNPDIDSSPFRPPRTMSASDEKRQLPSSSSTASIPGSFPHSRPESKSDSPSAWWYGPSPHRGPPPAPHLPSLRFLPPPSLQYGPPPVQLSPWFPGGRVASAQGHGYWYGAQFVGAPSPMARDPNVARSLPPHPHVFAPPPTPTSIHPAQSPRYPTKPTPGLDEHGLGHDCDQETETDHGYESTTTTTDSDPPPHTPVGTVTTSHCVEALQLHGDDEVEVHGVEIDGKHAAASVTIQLSDPSTPVKLLDRFSTSASPSLSSGSFDSHREGCESSRAAVVFPSLNGSFCQGSSAQMAVSLSSPGMSAKTTPARTMTPVSSSSSSSKEWSSQPDLGDEEDAKMKLGSRGVEASADSLSDDGPAFMLNLGSPPSTSHRPGFRTDSQGFWEPATPVSPSSSSSSLPLSSSGGKMGSRSTAEWIGDKTGPAPGECIESPEAASSRSLSPGPHRITSAGSTRSSSSRPASFSSPTSTSTSASASAFGGSHCSSPSPPNGASLPPKPTMLLPAFLATMSAKRKKASRTREIVDRLRSSSIDAGKGGVGLDSLGWPASPSAGGEVEGKLGKASSGSDHTAGNHVAGSQPSPPPPSRSGADSGLWVGSDPGKKEGQMPGSKSCDAGSSGSEGKSNGATHAVVPGSEIHFSHASPRTVTTTTTTNPGITPFPILSVPQTPASNFTMTRQSQTGGREPVVATPSKSAEGHKMNATVTTSPTARSSGPQLAPSTPNGCTSLPARPCHHPLPSPSHSIVHPPLALGPPPPILAVSAYPHPMYVSSTQYHVAPAHQGTWVAVFPGHPSHVPVHPIPMQTHVAPITGVSGMRHVSW